jgi:maleylpyruvate isomerase
MMPGSGSHLVRQLRSKQDGAMTKTAANLPADLNRLSRETDMLLATVDSLADEEFPLPSKCDGWTRAHVVAHLALGADALGNLVTWAKTGVETPAYASWDARNADIETLAKKSPAEIKAALHTAISNFADNAVDLQGGVKAETVKTPGGADITAYALPAMRISEVIIHHDDLDTTWELEEADIDALEDTLEIIVARVSAKEGFPGVTIDTEEGEHYVVGDGATAIEGGRDAVLGWLARGTTHGLHYDGELPERPAAAVG